MPNHKAIWEGQPKATCQNLTSRAQSRSKGRLIWSKWLCRRNTLRCCVPVQTTKFHQRSSCSVKDKPLHQPPTFWRRAFQYQKGCQIISPASQRHIPWLTARFLTIRKCSTRIRCLEPRRTTTPADFCSQKIPSMGMLLTLMRRKNLLTSLCFPRYHVNPSTMTPHKKSSQARCEQI